MMMAKATLSYTTTVRIAVRGGVGDDVREASCMYWHIIAQNCL